MKLLAKEHDSYETACTYYTKDGKLYSETWGNLSEISDAKKELAHLLSCYQCMPEYGELNLARKRQLKRVIAAIAQEFGYDVSKYIGGEENEH